LYFKAGINYQNGKDLQPCLENFLKAYDLTLEANIQFNREELYNSIILGLNQFAKNKMRSKQFYIAATSILESLKFYTSTENFNSVLFLEMIKRVSNNYYKAANFKKIRKKNILYAYFLAAISSLLTNRIDKAKKIMNEIDSDGAIVERYKSIVNFIISLLNENKKVSIDNFPESLQNFIKRYDEVNYLISLFDVFLE
jgi:hypothetical protein